jgi:hypothetical protein
MKRIKFIYVDHVGAVNSIDGEITAFLVNGEMAHVTWYRQGEQEFNGKYVIVIEYFPKEATEHD